MVILTLCVVTRSSFAASHRFTIPFCNDKNFPRVHPVFFSHLPFAVDSITSSLAIFRHGHSSSFFAEGFMQIPFDLLLIDPDGSFIWLEAAADLPLARARLRELASRVPGEYVLFDQAKQETIDRINSRASSSSR